MSQFTVSTYNESGRAVLVASGEIDCATALVFREAMQKLLRRGRVRLVVNLADVPFCDSSGLGVLVGGFKRTRACGGSIRLACVNPHLMRMLTITGLVKVIPVHSDVAEAIAADSLDMQNVLREAVTQ